MYYNTNIYEFYKEKYELWIINMIAKLVGVRHETIGNLENGKYNPSLKLAMDIAKIFDTTVEYIFSFEDDDE